MTRFFNKNVILAEYFYYVAVSVSSLFEHSVNLPILETQKLSLDDEFLGFPPFS